MIILQSRNSSLKEALKNEKSGKKLGSTQGCLQFKDLHRISINGWTPNEHAHVNECTDCRFGYSNFMKIKRNEARMALGLDPYEDIVERALGVRVKYKLG